MKEIAIYGIGTFGKLFYEALDKKVNFFIDDFSDIKEYDGKPVLKIGDIKRNTKIYISVLQSSKQIEETLINKEFTNVFSFSDSIFQMPEILRIISKKNYLWLINEKEKMLNTKKLDKVKSLLKDQKSINLLEKIIKLRQTWSVEDYIIPYDKEYFPKDIPFFNNLDSINFIDCGSYIGDTIKDLTYLNKNINYVVAFEPDSKNLEKLNQELDDLKKKNKDTKFIIFPCGVYSSIKLLSFSCGGISSSSHIADNAENLVSVVSLDATIKNMEPNYIKMDIEGAEKEAILGAKETIRKYKPNLAVCLYHKPEDLWELPLLINQIEPDYDMYLRIHEDMCLSTVLYCIPKYED